MTVARATAGAMDGGAARVEAMLSRHRPTLLWVARRWSGNAEDAEDALQRALEIYVRRLATVDEATELAWLKVVVRHEAMAVRRARAEGVPLDALDLAERVPAPDAAVQERIEREERVARSREALAQLKPDERTALLLKAEGYSYREIGERQGWTYTKVNRAITEGRRRFMRVFAGIEAGEECERFAPTLVALAAGGAEAADVVALRPHLRHCAACRATVRDLHASRLHRLALHLPLLAGIAPVRWLGDRVADGSAPRGLDVKALAHGVMHRFTGSDPATTMQLASTGGGGRGAAVAAVLSLCLGGGAGTYCAVTGGLPDPARLVQQVTERDDKRRAKPPRRRAERPAPTPTPAPTAAPAVAPQHPVTVTARSASSEPRPERRQEREPERRKREQRGDPQREFSFESAAAGAGGGGGGGGAATAPAATTATTSAPSSPPPSSPPASSAPPTSGGEFLP